jgi:aspartyl aminopeptidase
MERKAAWTSYSDEEKHQLEQLSRGYCAFLDAGKTERECVSEAVAMAKAVGYEDFSDYIAADKPLKPGTKLYSVLMGKTVLLFNLGSRPLEEGMNILGAHLDSPRLDIKQNPLYEDGGQAYLDTHYYGGIKKYQWVTIPLALHGVVAKKDGSLVDIRIGEQDNDPVFCITDLLVHLAGEQQEKVAAKFIPGEDLDLLIGNVPLADTEKDAVKANILAIIKEQYGLEEEDFLSAELEVVPAGRAREAGLDRSMLLAYGHDDRSCAYASLIAMLEEQSPTRTCCCVLVDKEEIGSIGATGAQSAFFENTIVELMMAGGEFSELKLRRCLAASRMLSSDVSSAFDPLYASYYDKRNSAFLGRGIVISKFSGVRGKAGANDANAEYLGLIRKIMDDNGVFYQTAELGKVDSGGGGTIAYVLAHYGMEVVDCGLPVLSMHSPWELISKADLYESKKCYAAFLKQI